MVILGSSGGGLCQQDSVVSGVSLTGSRCGTIAAVLTVGDVLTALERFAPTSRAAAWDSVGLQVGDPAAAVRTAAVCHEVTEAVVAAVDADPVDLLVTYHPLVFRPITRLVAGAHPAGRALRLAASGTAVAAVHTNADAAPGGAADALAEALGLGGVTGFGPLWGPDTVKVVTFVPDHDADEVAEAMARAGAGRIGAYRGCSFRSEGTGTFFAPEHAAPTAGRAGAHNREPEVRVEMVAPAPLVPAVVAALVAAHPYEEPAYDVYQRRGDAGFVGRIGALSERATLGEAARLVRSRLGGVLRVAGDPEAVVDRVAVVPGSGADAADDAVTAGADLLVTGDVGHHRARAAVDRGLAVIDPGHAATERPGVARLYAAVANVVPDTRDLGHDDPWRSP